MAEDLKDGGPAFGHGSDNGHCCGATLRDMFAAAALTGITVGAGRIIFDVEGMAAEAYRRADAMLTAREK